MVQETALRALARIRAEDKEALASVRRALAALAEQPRPGQAVPWGGSGIYRLRLPPEWTQWCIGQIELSGGR